MSKLILIIAIVTSTVMAQGVDAHWPTAAKNGFGTSNSLASKVWFTLANGVMTEVFFPTLDMPNVETLQLQVAIGGKIEKEVEDTFHRVEPTPNSLTFRQINSAKSGQYTITKTYITDPRRNTVLIRVDFDSRAHAQLSVYYDPSLNNSGLHDTAWSAGNVLLAVEGNVVQIGRLKGTQCTLALGFGETAAQAAGAARLSLARGFEAVKREYEAGWQRYVATLPRIPKHQRQFNMAAMVLKGLEDKTFRGASIASPST